MKSFAKSLLCSIVLAASGCLSSIKEIQRHYEGSSGIDSLHEKIDEKTREKSYEGCITIRGLESIILPQSVNTYFKAEVFCDFDPLKPNFVKISKLQYTAEDEGYINFHDLDNNGKIDGNDFIVYQTKTSNTITYPNGVTRHLDKTDNFTLTSTLYQKNNVVYTKEKPFDMFKIPEDIREDVKKRKISGYPYYPEKGDVVFLYEDGHVSSGGLEYTEDENKYYEGNKTFYELKEQYEEDIFPKVGRLIKELKIDYPY